MASSAAAPSAAPSASAAPPAPCSVRPPSHFDCIIVAERAAPDRPLVPLHFFCLGGSRIEPAFGFVTGRLASSELACAVCLGEPHEIEAWSISPACGHAVCAPCLGRMKDVAQAERRTEIACPTCRAEFWYLGEDFRGVYWRMVTGPRMW